MKDYVTRWRYKTRDRLLDAFGNQCGVCGYNRCKRNLAFHHLDPSQKDPSVWKTKKWDAIVSDIRGCVLLCHNCHGEVHDGLVSTATCPRFNEDFADYKLTIRHRSKTRKIIQCETCGKKTNNPQFCSRKCSSVKNRKVERPDKDHLIFILRSSSYAQVAREYNVRDHAVRRWIISYGLDPHDYGRNATRRLFS
jgi:hypothetical protein